VAKLSRAQRDLASYCVKASRVRPREDASAPDRASAGIPTWTNSGRIKARYRWTRCALVWETTLGAYVQLGVRTIGRKPKARRVRREHCG
jgi:hypothetical protein